jgi:hypothetical protein
MYNLIFDGDTESTPQKPGKINMGKCSKKINPNETDLNKNSKIF